MANAPHDPDVTADHLPSDSLSPPATQGTTDHLSSSGKLEATCPSAEAASDLPVVPGYRVLREIARGGMGRVLAALDLGLDRDVALKILLPGANADRFVRESKITARLPHPAIPPVHALGTLADGSPFLAMKLIAGQTLADEIKVADRPRLLQAFTQICQAVGFAHSRGIIHRDLKPANVMVGAFGEVLVMDWGLAKSLKDEAEPHSDASSLLSPSSSNETQAGQVMGTPAYMAPEQARGEATDARADVFALGGILCVILTGRPPFGGKTTLDAIRRAGAADLAETYARLNDCGADAELVALCRHCLSPIATDRPSDGQAVADAVTAYLDGVQERLQAAQRERAVAEARATEQRKRRRVQLALAAAVLLLLGGGGAFAWWQDRQASARKETEARLSGERDAEERNKQQQAAQSIDANLKLAAELRKQQRFEAANLALTQAATLATEGAPDRRAEVEQGIKELAFVVELDDIRFRKWIWIPTVGREGGFDTRGAAPAYRRAFAARGLDLPSLPPTEAAERIAASAVKAEMVAALDDWAQHEPEPALRDRLLSIARQADPGPWTDRLRDSAVRADRKAIEKLALDTPDTAPAATLSVLSDLMLDHKLNPVPMLSKARVKHPTAFELAFVLGQVQTGLSKNFEGIACYEAARALRPNNLSVWLNLGSELERRGDVNDAIVCFRQAIALDRNAAVAHYNLGRALAAQGEPVKAIACYRAAIAASPQYARAHVNLGILLNDRGELDEAIACYRAGVAADPKLREAHFNLGVALADKGEVDESITCYNAALAIAPKFAAGHNNLGNAWRRKGKVDQAIPCFRKAIDIDPQFAIAHCNLGETLFDLRKVDEAISCYRKALEIDPQYAKAHSNLGIALYVKRKPDEAIVSLRQGIAHEPNNAVAHHLLGLALDLTGKQKEAIEAWRMAAQVEPRFIHAKYWLGKALLLQGRPGEALEPLSEAAKHLPAAEARTLGLPNQLSQAKRLADLEKRLPDLLAGKDRLTEIRDRVELAELCRRQGRFAAATSFFAETFAADATLANDLGAGHRYRATCVAAKAGQGEDAARLRKQALDWLRADLTLHRKRLDSDNSAERAASQQKLKHWVQDRDLAGLRDPAALAKLPVEERKVCAAFWAEVADGNVGPFIKRIASLPAAEQVKEVGKELQKRNPMFDGALTPTIEKDVVIGLKLTTDHIKDISPIRALTRLKSLELVGSGGDKGSLDDLTPLLGMPLTELALPNNRALSDLSALRGMPLTKLNLGGVGVTDLTPLEGMPLETLFAWMGFRGSDLAPLKGMPLKWLNIGGGGQYLDLTPLAGSPLDFLCVNHTKVSDLAPLAEVPLTALHCANTLVSDLTPLRGMYLRELMVRNCKVTDLSPVRGMPLVELEINGTPIGSLSPLKRLPLKRISVDLPLPRDAEVLRRMGTLETINDMPAEKFWGTDGKPK